MPGFRGLWLPCGPVNSLPSLGPVPTGVDAARDLNEPPMLSQYRPRRAPGALPGTKSSLVEAFGHVGHRLVGHEQLQHQGHGLSFRRVLNEVGAVLGHLEPVGNLLPRLDRRPGLLGFALPFHRHESPTRFHLLVPVLQVRQSRQLFAHTLFAFHTASDWYRSRSSADVHAPYVPGDHVNGQPWQRPTKITARTQLAGAPGVTQVATAAPRKAPWF